MFIEQGASLGAIRQEGHVDLGALHDMALLTEGDNVSLGVYKHPPDGGPSRASVYYI